MRFAFEIRGNSWYGERIQAALRQYGAAFCIYHLAGHRSPREVTADFVYIRLQGPEGAYQGIYSKSDLAGWAGVISSWSRHGKEIFCYFDNDQQGYAVRHVSELVEMLQAG